MRKEKRPKFYISEKTRLPLKRAADAVLVPAQATYDAAVKAAGITLAGDVGDAEITAAQGSGSAQVTNTGGWNGAVSTYTGLANGAETTYTGSTNSALSAWVSATVTAENDDANAIASAFQTYIAAIGQAEVDHEQDIGDADEQYAEDMAQAEVDYHTTPTSPTTPDKCRDYGWHCDYARGASSGSTDPAIDGYEDYLSALGPAFVTNARAAAEAETARRVATRQAQKDRDDAHATADTAFIGSLASPIATEANNSTGEGNNFASDSTGNVNGLLSGVVGDNGTHATAHSSSDSTYGVDVATALKTYLVGLASLADGASSDPVEDAYSDAQAAATRDDKIREANADYTRAMGQLAKAHTFVTDMAGDGKDLSYGLAGIEKTFVTQTAPIIPSLEQRLRGRRSGAADWQYRRSKHLPLGCRFCRRRPAYGRLCRSKYRPVEHEHRRAEQLPGFDGQSGFAAVELVGRSTHRRASEHRQCQCGRVDVHVRGERQFLRRSGRSSRFGR